MSMLRNVLAAIGMTGSIAAGLSAGAVAVAAEQISAGVAKPLKAAQDATKKAQWSVAMEKLKEAQAASGKTAYDEYQIDNFLAYVLFSQKKMGEAAVVYERMLNSGQMPAAEVDARTKTLAGIYFQLKQYDKAAKYAKQALDKNPNQPDMALTLGQAYYLANDYKSAATAMGTLVNNAERAGQTPKEDWLRILRESQLKIENRDGATDTQRKLVRYYNKADDWQVLMTTHARARHSDRVSLGFYRLMLEVGVLKNDRDYMEMAQLAMDEKVGNAPVEAQRVVEQGVEQGVLKSTDKAQQGRYDRLLEAAKQRAAASRASLPQVAQQTQSAQNGQADVALGQLYMSVGEYDQAIGALQRGIKRGGVTDVDEAQIALGIAYLKKNQKDLARQAFKAVKKESQWTDLAELWALRA